MKTAKTKLPYGIKQQCLCYVRDYDRARREYLRLRREILDASNAHYVSYTAENPDGKPEDRRVYLPGSHGTGRPVENKQAELEKLENCPTVRQIRAVEHARAAIGNGLPDALADMIRDGIMLNCINGRKYPFERLYIVGICRSDFYRKRDQFFSDIAEELGLF